MPAIRVEAPFPGLLVVVGGQCRKVGKTALVVEVIKAFPNRNWTAVKITPYTESGCPVNGPACSCSTEDHLFAVREETVRNESTDTSRFLSAGASRALWLETKEHRLGGALRALASELRNAKHAIVESDAIVEFWKPSIFLMVLDPANPDFKSSARRNLPFADAFVFRSPFAPAASIAGEGVRGAPAMDKPKFLQTIGTPLPKELQHFLSCIVL
jgi:hypothetical protein